MGKSRPMIPPPETRCAYCGDTKRPFQAEHVVPRCLWDSKRPNHMVTVPACGPCNQDYARDEEYFRTVLVAMVGEGKHPEVEKLLDGKVKRGLTRNSRLRKEVTRGFGRRPQFTPAGLFAGWGWGFELDLDRFNRGIEKTVRGIFAYKSGRRLAPEYAVHIFPSNWFWQDQGFQNLLAEMSDWAGAGDDVFQGRCVLDPTDPDSSAWLFTYYKTVGVFAWTETTTSPGNDGTGGNAARPVPVAPAGHF